MGSVEATLYIMYSWSQFFCARVTRRMGYVRWDADNNVLTSVQQQKSDALACHDWLIAYILRQVRCNGK